MDWTETEVCIKCDNGGNLLFCSDSNCPLAVHEECMHCSAQFDSLGNFYCPYCSHKRAMLQTRKAREKAMLAKKALSAFLDEGMKQTVGDTKADNRDRLDGDGADYHFAQTEEDQVDETKAELMQDQEKGTALSSSGDDVMQKESVEDGDISDGENGYVSPHPRRVKEKNQNGIQSPRVNSPRRSASKLSKSRANSVHKEKKNATPKSGLTSPTFPPARRKKLPWTADEEEMLKEGVQKFSTIVNKNLPWRKILEFGRRVFGGTRTPADLKDKWRNILVKECSTK